MLLGTNLGARLGMLVALAGLFGWMVSMGLIWWIYGIGLKGKDPSWKPVTTVIGTENLSKAGIDILSPNVVNATEQAKVEGWIKLSDDNPGRGQAVASADEIIQIETALLKSGDYLPIAVLRQERRTRSELHDQKREDRQV